MVTSDEMDVVSIAEFKKETMDELAVDTDKEPYVKPLTEGVEQMVNDLVGSDSASDGQTIHFLREVFQLNFLKLSRHPIHQFGTCIIYCNCKSQSLFINTISTHYTQISNNKPM